jgi:hypothetical protein
MVTFVNNRIFKHKVMRINYTTYDLRRAQDSLNSRTHADFMTLPCNIYSGSTNDDFPYQFGRIIGIFHAMVLYNGTGLQLSEPQHMEFLFVRWFTIDQRYRGGWKSKRLHWIRFVNGDDDTAFGFLDPREVIRGVHLIPAFQHGQTSDLLPPSKIARPLGSDNDEDWKYFYVNM